MEIKINKEIRSYKETVYFGLTARQLICSLLVVGTAMRVAAWQGELFETLPLIVVDGGGNL